MMRSTCVEVSSLASSSMPTSCVMRRSRSVSPVPSPLSENDCTSSVSRMLFIHETASSWVSREESSSAEVKDTGPMSSLVSTMVCI